MLNSIEEDIQLFQKHIEEKDKYIEEKIKEKEDKLEHLSKILQEFKIQITKKTHIKSENNVKQLDSIEQNKSSKSFEKVASNEDDDKQIMEQDLSNSPKEEIIQKMNEELSIQKSYSQRIEELEQELYEYKNKLVSFEEIRSQYELNQQNIEKENYQKFQEIKLNFEDQISKHSAQNESLLKEIKQITEKNEKLALQYTELEIKNYNLENQVQRMEQEIVLNQQNLQDKLRQEANLLDNKESQIQQLNIQISEIQKQNSEQSQQEAIIINNQLIQENDKLNEQIKKLSNLQDASQKQYQIEISQLQFKLSEQAELLKKSSEAQVFNQNDMKSQDIQEIKYIQEIKQKNQETEAQNMYLTQQIMDLKYSLEELQLDYENVMKENDILKDKNQKFETHLQEELPNLVSGKNKVIQDLNIQINVLQENLLQKDSLLLNEQSKINTLNSQIKNLQVQLLEQESKIKQEYNLLINDLNNQINTLNDKLNMNQGNNNEQQLKDQIIEDLKCQNQKLSEQIEQQEKDFSLLTISGQQHQVQILDQQRELHQINDNLENRLKSFEQEILEKNNQIASLKDEIQNAKLQSGKSVTDGKKKVEISIEELVKWNTKAQSQQNQIKNLQMEVLSLKQDIAQREKLQNSKLMKSDLSLEGMEQKAKALQQIIDLTSQTNLKLEYENKQFKEQNASLKEDLQLSEKEIKQLREISSEKFRIESQLSQALNQVEELKNKTRDMQQTFQNLRQAENELQQLQKAYKQSEIQRNKYQKLYEENTSKLETLQSQLDQARLEKNQQNSKICDLERMLSQKFVEYQEIESKYNEVCQINEDSKNQLTIIVRRHSQEVEEFKKEIITNKDELTNMQETIRKQQSELQILKDNVFRSSNVVQNDPKKMTKQEKVILESLSNRVEELQRENHFQKITLEKQENELSIKRETINSLIKEITKNLPSQDESILDLEDKKLLKQYKQQDIKSLQNSIEKLVIENINLREQIKILGHELNTILQKQRNLK